MMKFSILASILFSAGCTTHVEGVEPSYPSAPGTSSVVPEDVKSVVAVNAECIARVIGPTPAGETLPNPNETMKRFNLGSTDFGNMWDAGNGVLWSVFGDNFDDRGGSWRSNAIAFSTDRNLADGLYYDDVLRGEDGRMKEFITSRAKSGQYADGSEYEITCIPTGGVSVPIAGGNRQYVHYMSVHQWDTDGADMWSVNYSEIVYSDDYGQTWTRSGVKWAADSKFAQIAYEKHGTTVYMFGTPSGRKSNVYLAKVEQDRVLDRSAYRYWDGERWSPDEADAEAVANGYVSEMTVRYNSLYKRWIMMYLSVNQRKLVYRDAAAPEGEWSAEKIVLDNGYGPSIHPWFCDSDKLWFVVSTVTSSPSVSWHTWHIHLWSADLLPDPEGFNMVWEGGFENDPNEPISYRTLWNCPNAISTHDCYEGKIACRLENGTEGEWKDACTQTIRLHKNTDYILTGRAKASVDGHTGAYLGVRLSDGRICDTNPPLSPDEWRLVTEEFNSGDCTAADVFFGTWGTAGLTVTVDDIKLTVKE